MTKKGRKHIGAVPVFSIGICINHAKGQVPYGDWSLMLCLLLVVL